MNLTETTITSEPTENASKKFEWNLGGWYASSVGATLWMIATPFLLSWPTPGVVAGIVGTLAVWSFASLAWGFRAKISAFKAIIGLLGATIVANLGFLLFAHANNLPLDGAAKAIESNYGLYYGLLLTLVISAMILFWLIENRRDKSAK